MLYIYGKGEANAGNEVNKYNIGEIMQVLGGFNSVKELVPYVSVLYDQIAELTGILDSMVPTGGKGVVVNSFGHEFTMKSSSVSYYNGRIYARMAPGIAINGGHMYVSKPSPGIASKYLEEIMGLSTAGGDEAVEIRYSFDTDSFKAKVKKKAANAGEYDSASTFYFPDAKTWALKDEPGYPSGASLIAALMNHSILGVLIKRKIGNDVTKVPLELTFRIRYGWNYFIMDTDGKIKITRRSPNAEQLQLARFYARRGRATNIDMTHEDVFKSGWTATVESSGWFSGDRSEFISPGTEVIFRNASSIDKRNGKVYINT